ncbi:PD-(D/E)XK motif protein [Cohnella sp. AR92]|uniref:PD-(D/E)XK motif protein n=1 Tax=Cohnella sp. AR92 TaxID=648716 RepID=UPI001EDD8186|nr:PD-(D/E)XK motif protein [Cohnella sp. AR92]
MLSNELLRDKWNRLSHHNSGYVRIDGTHPLEWHIGYENINQKSLLLVCNNEPDIFPSSKSILSSIGQRGDGKWALAFRLIRNENEEVFIWLCCDLIESSRNQTNSKSGIQYVMKRYKQWSRLMEQQKIGLLSESERKGLLGEMIHLQICMSEGVSVQAAVESWMGPEDADQDFIFPTTWHEVKALGIGSKTVSISSLEQLNVALPGALVLYFVDKTAPNESNSFTLLSKAAEIREALQHDQSALDLFNEKLLRRGFIDLQEYEDYWYRLSGTHRYHVDSTFPKLISGSVPSQIASASYELSINAIEGWRVKN